MYQDKDTPSRIAGHSIANPAMFFTLLLFPWRSGIAHPISTFPP